MESRVSFGMGHANYNLCSKSYKSPLLLFRSTPPFSAINKFLEVSHGNNNNNNKPSINKSKTTSTTSTNVDDLDDFSSSSSTNTLRMVNDITMRESNKFVDGLFFDENDESRFSDLSHEVVPRNEEINSLPSNTMIKGCKAKTKSKGFKEIIKGQWTEEEDRMLKTLVLKHGERKWAMIARSYLVGRAGKQCRERWHNHLRPDIKKHAWDEEEERQLVSAHQEFGNKWAEIARRIPGRSENSIKNHWNATKRRQNSRKKNKSKNKVDNIEDEPSDDLTIQPSILQEYIKNKYPGKHTQPRTQNPSFNTNKMTLDTPSQVDQNNLIEPSVLQEYIQNMYPYDDYQPLFQNPDPTTTTLNTGISPSFEEPPSYFDHNVLLEPSYDEHHYFTNPCHEELVFMQQLFKENPNNNLPYSQNDLVSANINTNDDDEIVDSMFMNSLAFDNDNNDYHNQNVNACLYNNNDRYLANLLEGKSSFVDQIGGSTSMVMNFQPYNNNINNNNNNNNNINININNINIKKDMDLFEMILSTPQFSSQSSSNSS